MPRFGWFARLVDRDGKLVQIVPVPARLTPDQVSGFYELDKGVCEMALALPFLPGKRFHQSRVLRNDDRMLMVEYLEVTRYGNE